MQEVVVAWWTRGIQWQLWAQGPRLVWWSGHVATGLDLS